MEVQLCLVVLLCAAVVDGQVYHIPAVNMATRGNSVCPPDGHMAAIKSELSNRLSDMLTMDMRFTCGSSGWKRVAFLNMTDPNQTCPDTWRLYEQNSVRACGRQESIIASCDSIFYSSDGYAYSNVCGRITGYQYASPDTSGHTPDHAIDVAYIDGVSVTYGKPRKHIWSFYGSIDAHRCCGNHVDIVDSLGFVGNNSFCDTGNPTNAPWQNSLFTEHPLWDGSAKCAHSDTCCAPGAGPWFYTSLPLPTMADIEVRICGDQETEDEDTPVELVEIYVK